MKTTVEQPAHPSILPIQSEATQPEAEKKGCPCCGAANCYILIALCAGIVTGCFQIPFAVDIAQIVSDTFIRLLKFVSLPIIFFSIISTASGMKSVMDIKRVGKRVLGYTMLTTILAASIALFFFLVLDPVSSYAEPMAGDVPRVAKPISYWQHLSTILPVNIVQPFLENNVMGVLFIAMALSLAILALPDHNRQTLHSVFSSLYAAFMKITSVIISAMPIGIWAFITLFFHEMQSGSQFAGILMYLACVLLANVVQGMVVLPLFLKCKGISPIKLARNMFPALSVAFFSKSSAGTLPVAMQCAEERAGVTPKIARFSLPLCTSINMNGCAAFILITVLFVSMCNQVTYTYLEMLLWVFLATIAAVGNAGVPMGCYFMASAFLAAMDVPLNILGIILPFYTLIDMVETALNVWSDSCVTKVVSEEMRERDRQDSQNSQDVQGNSEKNAAELTCVS